MKETLVRVSGSADLKGSFVTDFFAASRAPAAPPGLHFLPSARKFVWRGSPSLGPMAASQLLRQARRRPPPPAGPSPLAEKLPPQASPAAGG